MRKPAPNHARKFARLEVLLLCFVFSACGPNDPQPVLGSIFQLTGIATASGRTKPSQSRALSAGDNFSAGDEIQFQAGSSGVLCLTPGIYLRCFGPASIQIEELRISKDGDETGNAMKARRAFVRLGEGRVHAFLPRSGTAPTELKIDTGNGTIIAQSGSLFALTLTRDSIRVRCLQGELTWSNPPTFSTSIPAGYYCQRKFTDLAAADVLPASEEAAAQREVIAALDSAKYLDELETAARTAPAPWRKH